ncbi:CGNR zinc finger domain-containing protein [Actinacidiphila glaucinigra]|uniref:CGNR zinc finger domain-containing protein n=1 Tax=Actinacidiphila glaucinigra TaxID=235986 RepID=UPI003711CBA6
MVQWIATERISGLVPAPGGLAFVQDLLNSSSDGLVGPRHTHDDLLSDIVSARNWLTSAGRALGESSDLDFSPPSLPEEDLPALRELRSELRLLVSGQAEADQSSSLSRLRSAAVTVATTSGPSFVALPSGYGWHWVASAVLAESFNAQREGTWRRLKACRNPACVAVFYDRTRNNIGVWHSLRSCGNPANLRASRARKRASAEDRGS